jgi:putative transposase
MADLVHVHLVAAAPNRGWVAGLTYKETQSSCLYLAFVVDVRSRYLAGWQASRFLRAELALDALEMSVRNRRGERSQGLAHRSDRGVQDLAVRYAERPDQAGAVASVGPRGDSNDCALTESFNSPYKTALVRQLGPWRGLDDGELDTLEWVDWSNKRRLHA